MLSYNLETFRPQLRISANSSRNGTSGASTVISIVFCLAQVASEAHDCEKKWKTPAHYLLPNLDEDDKPRICLADFSGAAVTGNRLLPIWACMPRSCYSRLLSWLFKLCLSCTCFAISINSKLLVTNRKLLFSVTCLKPVARSRTALISNCLRRRRLSTLAERSSAPPCGADAAIGKSHQRIHRLPTALINNHQGETMVEAQERGFQGGRSQTCDEKRGPSRRGEVNASRGMASSPASTRRRHCQ